MQRKITLTLEDDLLTKARVLAASRNRSVSALLREELSRLVAKDEAYEAAKRAALKRLERAHTSAVGPSLPEPSFTIVPAFVDANILIYAEDLDAGSKHTIARALVS